MATQYSYGKIITDGLVLSLDASDRNSYVSGSTTWGDLAGNNNGTLTNGPSFSSNGNASSIVFDGVDDYIALPNGLLSGTSNFTINQWIQSTNPTIGGTTFGNYPGSPYPPVNGNLQIFFGTNYIGMWLDNPSTYLGTSPWNTTLPEFTTSPVMITAQRQGTTTYFYINGLLKKTGSSSATIGNSSQPFRLGINTVNSETYRGTIFTTQVYNRALSANEILQIYNAQKSRFGLT